MNATIKPRAWLCELAQEDGTTRTQFVEQDPEGLRWNDAGEPSPYRTTPLLTLAQAQAMVAAERAESARLRHLLNLARDDYNTAAQRLQEIGDFAHDHSTGPAVPDALWEVRAMAYGSGA